MTSPRAGLLVGLITGIAIVGDHGEQFGEHGLGAHGTSIYEQHPRAADRARAARRCARPC